jgi:hypothetical protein
MGRASRNQSRTKGWYSLLCELFRRRNNPEEIRRACGSARHGQNRVGIEIQVSLGFSAMSPLIEDIATS